MYRCIGAYVYISMCTYTDTLSPFWLSGVCNRKGAEALSIYLSIYLSMYIYI